jgi:NADH-quinone oxidoreductase subunit I
MAVQIPQPKHGFSREMTFWERLYLPAIVRGLRVTLKHFFAPRWTVQYPEEKPEVSSRFRGLHRLKRDEQGRERCTACMLCSYVCPANAIRVVPAYAVGPERELYAEERYAAEYEINMLRCIFCGFCEEACPCGAIYMGREWETSDTEVDHFIYRKEMLLETEGTPLEFVE